MSYYTVTVDPKTCLFLARERGNRAIRHSFHYIPASTIAGALNTYFYQIGREDLFCQFRFSNLYPSVHQGNGLLWLPSPRNTYFCPNSPEHERLLIDNLSPSAFLNNLVCDQCKAKRRPHIGFVQAKLQKDSFIVNLKDRRSWRVRLQEVEAQALGRTALYRSTGCHVNGGFHSIEILKYRGHSFKGDVLLRNGFAKAFGEDAQLRFSLIIGGSRSRGCGRVDLVIESNNSTSPKRSKNLILVDTPILPLPKGYKGRSNYPVKVTAPYARLDICERWAAKPLPSGKGLVSFHNTLAVGSVLKIDNEIIRNLGESMFFYSYDNEKWSLHKFNLSDCAGKELKDQGGRFLYSFGELWSLGFGRLRYLFPEE